MKTLLAATLILIGLSAAAFAQQNEGRNAPSRPSGVAPVPDTANRPYSRAITGRILKVSAEENLLIIDTPKAGAIKFVLEKSARIKADKNTGLADRKDISLADYEQGQSVKITYRLADNKVIEIRLKPTAN